MKNAGNFLGFFFQSSLKNSISVSYLSLPKWMPRRVGLYISDEEAYIHQGTVKRSVKKEYKENVDCSLASPLCQNVKNNQAVNNLQLCTATHHL